MDAKNIRMVEPVSNLGRTNPHSQHQVEERSNNERNNLKRNPIEKLKGGTTQTLGTQLTNLTTLSLWYNNK